MIKEDDENDAELLVNACLMVEETNEMSETNSNNFLKCELCHQFMQSPDLRSLHYVLNHGCSICSVCSQVSITMNSFKIHVRSNHSQFSCDLCEIVFLTYGELLKHRNNFHELFKCPLCIFEFFNESHVDSHLFKFHRISVTTFLLTHNYVAEWSELNETYYCNMCGVRKCKIDVFSHFLDHHQISLLPLAQKFMSQNLNIRVIGVDSETDCQFTQNVSFCKGCSEHVSDDVPLAAHKFICLGDIICKICFKSQDNQSTRDSHIAKEHKNHPCVLGCSNRIVFDDEDKLNEHCLSVHDVKPCYLCGSYIRCAEGLMKQHLQTCHFYYRSDEILSNDSIFNVHCGNMTVSLICSLCDYDALIQISDVADLFKHLNYHSISLRSVINFLEKNDVHQSLYLRLKQLRHLDTQKTSVQANGTEQISDESLFFHQENMNNASINMQNFFSVYPGSEYSLTSDSQNTQINDCQIEKSIEMDLNKELNSNLETNGEIEPSSFTHESDRFSINNLECIAEQNVEDIIDSETNCVYSKEKHVLENMFPAQSSSKNEKEITDLGTQRVEPVSQCSENNMTSELDSSTGIIKDHFVDENEKTRNDVGLIGDSINTVQDDEDLQSVSHLNEIDNRDASNKEMTADNLVPEKKEETGNLVCEEKEEPNNLVPEEKDEEPGNLVHEENEEPNNFVPEEKGEEPNNLVHEEKEELNNLVPEEKEETGSLVHEEKVEEPDNLTHEEKEEPNNLVPEEKEEPNNLVHEEKEKEPDNSVHEEKDEEPNNLVHEEKEEPNNLVPEEKVEEPDNLTHEEKEETNNLVPEEKEEPDNLICEETEEDVGSSNMKSENENLLQSNVHLNLFNIEPDIDPCEVECVVTDTSDIESDSEILMNNEAEDGKSVNDATCSSQTVRSSDQSKRLPGLNYMEVGPNGFACEVCCGKFEPHEGIRELLKHMRNLHGFSCNFSGLKLSEAFRFNRANAGSFIHMQPGLVCPKCSTGWKSKRLLRKHVSMNHGVDWLENAPSGPLSYQCRYCKQSFWRANECYAHEKENHSNQKVYECHICNDVHLRKVLLNKHLKRAHPLERLHSHVSFRCKRCSKLYPTYKMLERHVSTRHPDCMLVRCPHCHSTLKSKKHLEKHVRQQHTSSSNKECQCEHCGRILYSKRALAIHIRFKHDNTNKYRYKCRLCEKTFDSKEQRNTHYKADHAKENLYHCSECGKGFGSKSGLYSHKQVHLMSIDAYRCKHCDKLFSRRDCYNEHLQIHAGPRHTCPHCPKEFVQRSNMVRHIRIHTGEKPYKCTFCDKMFSDKGACNSHMRVHTREEVSACPFCDKTFSKKQKLKYHIRRHTGEGMVSCNVCGKSFTHNFLLKGHISKCHQTQLTCKECQKVFNNAGNLKRHVESCHNSTHGFSCQLCTKTFDKEAAAKKHLISHASYKTLLCPHCEKHYTTLNSLKKHLTSIHKLQKENPDFKSALDKLSAKREELMKKTLKEIDFDSVMVSVPIDRLKTINQNNNNKDEEYGGKHENKRARKTKSAKSDAKDDNVSSIGERVLSNRRKSRPTCLVEQIDAEDDTSNDSSSHNQQPHPTNPIASSSSTSHQRIPQNVQNKSTSATNPNDKKPKSRIKSTKSNKNKRKPRYCL